MSIVNENIQEKFILYKKLFNTCDSYKSVTDFDNFTSFFVFPIAPENILVLLLNLNKVIEINYPCITVSLHYDQSEENKKYENINLNFKYYSKTGILSDHFFTINSSIKKTANLVLMRNFNTENIQKWMRIYTKANPNRLVPFSLKNIQKIYNECTDGLKTVLEKILFDDIEGYFINDIKNDFRKNMCGLSYAFEKLSEFHNRKNFLETIMKRNLPKYYNKYPLQKGYALALLQNYVEENHFNELRLLPDSFFYEYIKRPYKKPKIKALLSKYYYEKCNITTSKSETLVSDFIDMYMRLKLKIPLKCSLQKISELHDKAAVKLIEKIEYKTKTAKLMINDKYNYLIEHLSQKYEVINTVNRLKLESLFQHNCVISYTDKINRGDCIILSLFNQEKRYTIEIGMQRKKYRLLQFLGKYNSSPEIALIKNINQEIKIINKELKDTV